MKNKITLLTKAFFPLLTASALSGFLTGALIFLFRCAGTFVVRLSQLCHDFAKGSIWQGGLVFVLTAVLCLGTYYIMKAAPFSKGGGIPFALVLSSVKLKFNWLLTLVATFFSSLITFFVGIPLGNEGPSVQLGALTGFGALKVLKNENRENAECIIKAGAGAGFCAATGSALGGFAFSIEEMHGKVRPLQLASSFVSVIFAYCTATLLCGVFGIDFNLFHSLSVKMLPLKYYFIPILVGVVCAVFAILFSKAAIALRRLNSKSKTPLIIRLSVVFTAAFLLALFFSDAAFSGHDLIDALFLASPIWYVILVLIVLRTAMMITSNSLGITGGLFVPLLTIGALFGAACLAGFKLAGGYAGEYEVYFILTAFAAFIAATNKMPLTITLFTAEIICGFENVLPVVLAVGISYVIFMLSRQKDLTEVVCENINPERS